VKNVIDLVIASNNLDKVREMMEILPDPSFHFRSMRDAGFTAEILEDGSSFEENALIKARAVHEMTGGYVLSDDSGLAVDLLDGAPGIYSARFAGENTGYSEKIAFLQQMLSPWPPETRDASFICVMALVRPDGSSLVARGECRGRISPVSRGSGGFGYDPVFYLPDLGMTMAQLPTNLKHLVSHRGQALRKMAGLLLDE
jgi:XTP/dITP diphosphohydrolase